MSGAEWPWISVHERMPEQGLWVLTAAGRVGSRHIDILGLAIVNSWGQWAAVSGTPIPEAAVVEYWCPLPEVDHLVPHKFRKREGSQPEVAP